MTALRVVQLDNWAEPIAWPQPGTFCVAAICNANELMPDSFCELMVSAIRAGTCSIFTWSTNADMAQKAADAITLNLSFHAVTDGEVKSVNSDFVIIGVNDAEVADALETMTCSWMEYLDNKKGSKTLVVVGIHHDHSFEQFKTKIKQR